MRSRLSAAERAATLRPVLLSGIGRGGGYVDPKTLAEVAELLGTTEEDISVLRYGRASTAVMLMSFTQQLDRERGPNKSATLVLQRFAGKPVTVRGDVVCFPAGAPFSC